MIWGTHVQYSKEKIAKPVEGVIRNRDIDIIDIGVVPSTFKVEWIRKDALDNSNVERMNSARCF